MESGIAAATILEKKHKWLESEAWQHERRLAFERGRSIMITERQQEIETRQLKAM